MHFASAISDSVSAQTAADEACSQISDQFLGMSCDIAFIFASTIYQVEWEAVLDRIHQRLRPKVLLGCSGGGIIGSDKELEWVPGFSMLAAHMPDVGFHPFAVTAEELEQSQPGGFWIDKVGLPPGEEGSFLLFADPLTCNPVKLLTEINQTYRRRPVSGGLVSGGQGAGEHMLFQDQRILREGAVGLALNGNVAVDTIVSQGCRPIGKPFVVTEADSNIILKLGGRQAVVVLHEVLSSLAAEDRELAQQGAIFAGLVVDEMRPAFVSGDFLIRNIIGIDPATGAVAISDEVEIGKTFQFHLRDANTSRDELRRLLQQTQHHRGSPPAGALFFNCLGRGKSLYGVSHHDVKTIRTLSGKFPLSGFFCSGEIGPIGSSNFIHGYTASLALFRPVEVPAPRKTTGRTQAEQDT